MSEEEFLKKFKLSKMVVYGPDPFTTSGKAVGIAGKAVVLAGQPSKMVALAQGVRSLDSWRKVIRFAGLGHDDLINKGYHFMLKGGLRLY